MMPLDPPLDAVAFSYVLETDQAPEVWQFLNGLRGDDLLVELIVNDLDARSPSTEVRFESDRMICVGAGNPIDDEGWARLRKFKGAGDQVKAKEGLFGVKNHGLKACFTLGNEIIVRSAGMQILQTLFKDGPDAPAYPGVRIPVAADPGAPPTGTQIEVPYRRRSFIAPHGENLPFAAVDDLAIEDLFRDAVANLPHRLLGIIRPTVLEAFILTLYHHQLGLRTFQFSCGRAYREGGLVVFSRECREIAANTQATLIMREQAALLLWSPDQHEKRPRYFHSGAYRFGKGPMFPKEGLVVEASWSVDASGRPKSAIGRLRYPIAYPGEAPGALTSMSVHYAGPFVSDTERHELGAQAKDWNDRVVAACDETMAQALEAFLLDRHGAPALELVAQLEDNTRLRGFVEHLLAARALPAVDSKGKPVVIGRKSLLLVPTYTQQKRKWSAALAAVAPPNSVIVSPKTPPSLLELLSSGVCRGWNANHLRFDEVDILDRMAKVDTEHFPWRSEGEWKRVLGQPAVAAAHLDALLPLFNMPGAKRPVSDDVHLPDANERLHPFPAMRRGVSLPSDLIGLDLPPVIHPVLKDHQVFRFDGWKLAPYTFRDMLRDGDLEGRSDAARKRFFNWLAKNPKDVGRDDWPPLKGLAIWPATDRSLQRFEDLCLLDSQIGDILGLHVRRPSREVRRLCHLVHSDRIRLKLRDEPTPEEIATYHDAGLSRFPRDRPLEDLERQGFAVFEAQLLKLCRSDRAARALKSLASRSMALNRVGSLRPTTTMVRETNDVARMRLCDEDLIDRPLDELDRILPPAPVPTAAMALRALKADPTSELALLPRLRTATTTFDPALLAALRALPCLPVEGRLRASEELAFKGNLGDFWGTWKTTIGVGNLADDAQSIYRAAGVMRGFPEPETSRAFFAWLAGQPASVIKANLPCVVRHLGHRNGVGAWRLQPPEIPCIPVEEGAEVVLLTITEAKRSAVIDDFPQLADVIRTATPPFSRRLAIHSVAKVTQPIGDELRAWGVPTLSELAKGPLDAKGEAPVDAPRGYLQAARGLAAPSSAKRFRKQLQDLDVPLALLEPNFQRRLAAIKAVKLARRLQAQFKIGSRIYWPDRPWAVLPQEIWLDLDEDTDGLLMNALADLVFVHPHPRFLPAILKAALSTSARDYRPTDTPAMDDPDASSEDDEDDADEAKEAAQRHPGSEPDPNRNQPKPGPLFTGNARVRQSGGGGKRKQVITEDIQRRQLKAEHYAHHCQMELALHAPEILAPAGSYVEFAENRRKIMEAHHPDKVVSDGSRHAGNLLILSRINHERVGTRLSRGDVSLALQRAWTPQTIAKPDGSPWLKGGVATAVDPVTGDAFPLFFTDTHRAYWLEMARQKLPRDE